MLTVASETGKIIEKKLATQFETCDRLKELILLNLETRSLRNYNKSGVIVIDNLESLSVEEKERVKDFIDTQTPAEMQFIVTSRNSEEYDLNYKLSVFSSLENGTEFVCKYSEENNLELELNDTEIQELLNLSKGNTLVLVLSLRRMSHNLLTLNDIKMDFTKSDMWSSIRQSLSQVPPNAFEIISQFMYKDTFEQLEKYYTENTSVFYKVLRVIAVSQNDGLDLSTLCVMTKESYPQIENVVDLLCNYLILEKQGTNYIINGFAEKYIMDRFAPDSETYDRLRKEIDSRKKEISDALEKLDFDMKSRKALSDIMNDWNIISDTDRISAANMYGLYSSVKKECKYAGRLRVEETIQTFIESVNEAERITAHPYIKYQKARILQIIDDYPIYDKKHTNEIVKSFYDAVYSIRMIPQYSIIQQTKSYAALLWLFGQYLHNNSQDEEAMRKLEESRAVFEQLNKQDKEYYKCISLLGSIYLNWYKENPVERKGYLKKAKKISSILQTNWDSLAKETKQHASELRRQLINYGG